MTPPQQITRRNRPLRTGPLPLRPMSSEGTIRVETINNGGECSVLYPGEPGVQPE